MIVGNHMNHRNKSLSTVSRLRVLLITLVHWRHLGLKSSQWSASEMNRNEDAILLIPMFASILNESSNGFSPKFSPTASSQTPTPNPSNRSASRAIHPRSAWQLACPDFSSDRKSDPKRMLVGDDFTTCVFFLFLPSSSGMFLPCDPGETTLFGRFFFGSSKAVAHWTHTTHCGTSMKKQVQYSSFIDLCDPNSNVDAFFHFGGEFFLILRLMLSTCSWSRRLLSVQISISIYWRLQDTWNKTHQTGSQEDLSETLIYLLSIP